VDISLPAAAEAAIAVEPAPAFEPPLDDPWASPDVAAPHMGDEEVVRRPDARRTGVVSEKGKGVSLSWVRTTASRGGVVALILLLAWGYRWGTGASARLRFGSRARHPGLIEVLSRTNLTPRQSVCLVRVGPQLVLIGATSESLRPLSVIHDPNWAAQLAGDAARRRPDSLEADFQRCLVTEAQAYGENQQREGSALPAPRIVDIREKLAQTVQRLRSSTGGA
jgi:flagellar biogenesis protein FliO